MGGISRRYFLGCSLAPLALPVAASRAEMGSTHWPRLKDSIIINTLGFVDDPNRWLSQPSDRGSTTSLVPRALRDLRASGTTAINVTIGYVAGPMGPYEHSVNEVASWNQLIRRNSDDLLKVWTGDDIVRAKRENKVGIILGFQNATMMGDKDERVDTFAGLGVKVIQLTYNRRNQLGDGSMEAENRGLTPFGREVVERLNATNTLVDLSHSGEQTCLDAIEASSRPVCISHTGCRALADLPRNKTDRELRLLAEKGGMVGIYFMPFLKQDSFPDATDVAAHVEHAIKVCGEDHVAIGTDGTTTQVDDLAAYRSVINKEIEERRAAGISARGEKPGVVPFIPDLQGPGQFQQLADLLAARGHRSARIEKILGGNALRLMREIWD